MMTLRIVGIILFQTGFQILSEAVCSEAVKLCEVLGAPGRVRRNEKEILEAAESRYHTDGEYTDRDYGITTKEFDLPITFKAPHYEAHDYWRNEHDLHNRRTFFESYPPGAHGKTTPFPNFYQFMTSIFGGRDDSPEAVHYSRHRATPPNTFETPFGFNPTEPNYIPSPKPIRASVIKLETITSSPIYPPFEYDTAAKHYPHTGSILNHVFNENPKGLQSGRYHPEPPLPQGVIPPFKPLPVLPKPEFIPPTTMQPIYSGYFNNHTRNPFKYHNITDYKYPESVQDKLPHLNLGEVRIPYISEKPAPQIFDAYPKETSRERQFGHAPVLFPASHPRETTNGLGLIDIRSLNSPGTNSEGTEKKQEAMTVKSFPGAVEKVKRPTFKYTKKLTAQLDKTSVERVTNLTVQGFSKMEHAGPSFRQNINYLNVRELINYEMGKMENVPQNISSSHHSSQNSSSTRPVNLNDEFSLDAKILKDTNWDGLTVPPEFTTTEEPRESTTLFVQRFEPKPKTTTKPAFWEIVEGQTTILPNTPKETTEATTVTDQSIRTTTDVPFWYTATEVTEASEPTTPRISGKALRLSEIRESLKPVTEEPESVDSTTLPERTTPVRRYSRRPKVVNFTPYPTPEELQRRLTSRNHFPKRSKPNITITFGNKNILKSTQSLGKEEFVKFSEEDVRKRRKIGKRRQVYKRLRTSTTEPTAD